MAGLEAGFRYPFLSPGSPLSFFFFFLCLRGTGFFLLAVAQLLRARSKGGGPRRTKGKKSTLYRQTDSCCNRKGPRSFRRREHVHCPLPTFRGEDAVVVSLFRSRRRRGGEQRGIRKLTWLDQRIARRRRSGRSLLDSEKPGIVQLSSPLVYHLVSFHLVLALVLARTHRGESVPTA